MTSPALSDRTRRILAALIREYIETGEPVASAALTRRAGLALSSATIRNVLAQLEEMGFVWQPHTSAGRVPDRSGLPLLRRLAARGPPARARTPRASKRGCGQQAGDAPLIDDLLSSASHVLSEVSRHVGFAIAPANAQAIFHRIEFVPLSSNRILVVIVARGNQVSQKTIDIGEEVAQAELVTAANYLNDEFSGRTLDEVREGVLTRLREERTLYDQLLGLALRLASSSLADRERPDGLHRRHLVAARRGRARQRAVDVDAARVAADGRRKAAARPAAQRIHRRTRPDGRDRRRAQRSGTAPVQPDCLHVFRWPQHDTRWPASAARTTRLSWRARPRGG